MSRRQRELVLDWESIWEELWRVLRMDGFAAICCNIRLLSKLIEMQPATFRYAIHWFKSHHANIMQRKSQPRRHLEHIAFFGRVAQASYTPQMTPNKRANTRTERMARNMLFGNRLLSHGEGTIVYDNKLPIDLHFYDWEPNEKINFPTQKPIAMGLDLIRTCGQVGDVILDLTTGSGTFAIAAQRLGSQFIAVEREEKHFRIASDRLDVAPLKEQAEAAD
jgi:site-specific DNA-methyltransferase (adenine-specific)